MDEDQLILVNRTDEVTGYAGKMEVHKKGLLHRAFSVFVYDFESSRMLLQKRAQGKYHSGGLWTNACCSHPRKGEDMDTALSRRLLEELGLRLFPEKKDVLYDCGSFIYFASFGELSEHELDHVWLYCPQSGNPGFEHLSPDPGEIEELLWISIPDLDAWLCRAPEDFTAWFAKALALALPVLKRQMEKA